MLYLSATLFLSEIPNTICPSIKLVGRIDVLVKAAQSKAMDRFNVEGNIERLIFEEFELSSVG